MKTEPRQAQAIVLLIAGLLCADTVHAQATHPAAAVLKAHIMLAPEDIRWGECPPAVPPGASCSVIEGSLAATNRLFAFRVRMPDNYLIPPHFHPAIEHVTVVKGTFKVGMGEKFDPSAMTSLPAGTFAALDPGVRHFAEAEGETILQLHGDGPWSLTYVNPADDPRQRTP